MYNESGTQINLLKHLEKAKANKPIDIPVMADMRDYGLGMLKLRVCALRK
jgi:hypothetical protein